MTDVAANVLSNTDTSDIKNSLEDLLCSSVGKETFQIWFAGIMFLRFEKKSNTCCFSITNAFRLRRIQEQYLDQLLDCAEKLFPDTQKISLHVQEQNSFESINILPTQTTQIKKTPGNFSPATKKKFSAFTLENYIVGDFNQIPVQFAKEICNNIGKINPLYIHSSVGLGKTHLLHAIMNSISKRFPFLKIFYTTPVEFLEEFIASLKNKKDSQFRIKYKSVDVLLVDDIQLFSGKERTCTEFFHIFNEIYQPNKQMIFCSDCTPEQLSGIADRLKSRISSSIITNICPPSPEDRKSLLKHFLKNRGLALPDALQEQIALGISSDIRMIQGFVSSLASYSMILNKSISEELCLKLLSQLSNQTSDISKEEPEKDFSQHIIKIVSEKTNTPIPDLISTKIKNNRTNFFKNVLMYLLRDKSKLSLGKIGKIAGKKNGASVQFGINKVQRKIDEDPKIKTFVSLLSQKISDHT